MYASGYCDHCFSPFLGFEPSDIDRPSLHTSQNAVFWIVIGAPDAIAKPHQNFHRF
jgi:hypothetical protein